MFKPETKILFQEPTADTRLLRSAVVVESSQESFSIRFESNVIELDEGQELIAYFHGKTEFMQQTVLVIELVDDEDGCLIDLEPVGDAISAENREHYRAPAISADLFAAVNEDRNLAVQDVSATGFSVVSASDYLMGAVLEASLSYEGDLFSGRAVVQSIREFSPMRIRYGLRALDGGDLPDGLRSICLAVQRDQLKRQGGGG